jgi:hypothetical protein
VVNFIIHKSYSTHFTVLRRTRELHATCFRIELHISFVKQQNGGEEMFFEEQEWVIGFFSINLLMELFINYLEPNDRDCWHNGKQLDEDDIV